MCPPCLLMLWRTPAMEGDSIPPSSSGTENDDADNDASTEAEEDEEETGSDEPGSTEHV